MLQRTPLAPIAWLVVTLTGCAEPPGLMTTEHGIEEAQPAPNETTGTKVSASETPNTDAPLTPQDEPPPSTPPTPTTPTPTPPPPSKPAPVTFRVLTYNVAGLPEGISSSTPTVNMPQISPKLNPFELVLVQEDFSYHSALISAVTHPFLSTPKEAGLNLGDGLNALSRFPFSALARTEWSKCNGYIDQGSDCLTTKGFSRFVLDLGNGRTVDVYNTHFDAGRAQGDVNAREAQVDQLNLAIAQQSAGNAVLITGDTNMKASDEATFQKLLAGSSLQCACRALNCPEPNRIDRVLFRSSATVTLTPKSHAVETSFVDAAGNPLSDHEPVSVTFDAD